MNIKDALARVGLQAKDASIRGWLEFGPPVRVDRQIVLANAALGAYSYAEFGVELIGAKVGPYCSIGRAARIGLSAHTLDAVSTHPFLHRNFFAGSAPDYPRKIEFNAVPDNVLIGGDVWIGTGAMIVGHRATRIGAGAVIAAGSVVTKDVEPYAIVAGNPARVVRRRFSDAVCEEMLKTEWWAFDLPRYGADNPHDAPALDQPEPFLDWWRDGGRERLRATPRLDETRLRVGIFNDTWRLQRKTSLGWIAEELA